MATLPTDVLRRALQVETVPTAGMYAEGARHTPRGGRMLGALLIFGPSIQMRRCTALEGRDPLVTRDLPNVPGLQDGCPPPLAMLSIVLGWRYQASEGQWPETRMAGA
mmetsp:Transcript_13983/g.38207  ORF Transcript_13983/g.38207 Transcript_13983/m.38207 type:complete len:108 (-) Transcript_13983:39-362(-)